MVRMWRKRAVTSRVTTISFIMSSKKKKRTQDNDTKTTALKFVRKLDCLKQFTVDQLEELLDIADVISCSSGHMGELIGLSIGMTPFSKCTVAREGDTLSSCYVVISGVCESNSKPARKITAGQCIGHALLRHDPIQMMPVQQSSTIVRSRDAHFMVLKRDLIFEKYGVSNSSSLTGSTWMISHSPPDSIGWMIRAEG